MGKHARGTKFHTEEALTAYKMTECQSRNRGQPKRPTQKVCSVNPASPIPYPNHCKERKTKMQTTSKNLNQKMEDQDG